MSVSDSPPQTHINVLLLSNNNNTYLYSALFKVTQSVVKESSIENAHLNIHVSYD